MQEHDQVQVTEGTLVEAPIDHESLDKSQESQKEPDNEIRARIIRNAKKASKPDINVKEETKAPEEPRNAMKAALEKVKQIKQNYENQLEKTHAGGEISIVEIPVEAPTEAKKDNDQLIGDSMSQSSQSEENQEKLHVTDISKYKSTGDMSIKIS